MLFGGHTGGLELRRSGDGVTVVSGSFPYGITTTLWDGGRSGQAHKETIAARAFSARVDAGEDVHFLAGHDFEKPLASRAAGSLDVHDTETALTFEARIAPALAQVSYVRDFLGALEARLIKGLSPGFRVAPKEDAESVETRDGAIVRTVKAADLFEISAVTRPAYPQAQIEARSWQFGEPSADHGLVRALNRWRA